MQHGARQSSTIAYIDHGTLPAEARCVKLAVYICRSSENDRVQAFCPDLPGCAASAKTEVEAIALLRLRLAEHFVSSTRRAPAGTRLHILEV